MAATMATFSPASYPCGSCGSEIPLWQRYTALYPMAARFPCGMSARYPFCNQDDHADATNGLRYPNTYWSNVHSLMAPVFCW